MRIKQFLVVCSILFFFSHSIFAATNDDLQGERIAIIKRYIHLLGRGDYHTIPTLFTERAVAVSASGESDDINRFYENMFTKSFSSPESKLINIFDGRIKGNMMTAYYNLSWVNHQGDFESSKFVDLFIFEANSCKIKTIYVFSNSFKQQNYAALKKHKAL